MSENTKTQKKSWFKGLQAEFKKVIWPDKNTLTKQTTAVVAVSVILGALIAVIDAALKYGIDFSKIVDRSRKVILCQRQNGMSFIPIQGMRTK